MKRKPMSRRGAKKSFRKSSGVHKKNSRPTMRGGYRL